MDGAGRVTERIVLPLSRDFRGTSDLGFAEVNILPTFSVDGVSRHHSPTTLKFVCRVVDHEPCVGTVKILCAPRIVGFTRRTLQRLPTHPVVCTLLGRPKPPKVEDNNIFYESFLINI